MLWGSYISNIPKGNMGNLLIYPGTHHTIASQLKKGQNQFFDKINDKKPEDTLHILKKEGIADA